MTNLIKQIIISRIMHITLKLYIYIYIYIHKLINMNLDI